MHKSTLFRAICLATTPVLVVSTFVPRGLALEASPSRLAQVLLSQASLSVSETRAAAAAAIAKAAQLRSQAQWKDAIQEYATGLKLLEQLTEPTLEDRYQIAQTQSWLILAHRSVGEYTQALAYGQKARQSYQALGDRPSQGNVLSFIAGVYSEIGDYPQSLKFYQQALSQYSLDADKTLAYQAYLQSWLGDTYRHLGETPKALAAYRQAVSLWQKLGNVSNQAEALDTIALMYTNLGDMNQVRSYLNQAKSANPAFTVEKSIGYQGLETFYQRTNTSQPSVAAPYLDILGEYDQKITKLQQLQQVAEQSGNLSETYTLLQALANTYHYSRGDYQNAVTSYQRALGIAQKIGNRAREADCLLGIAEVFTTWGKKQEALDYNLQALEIQQRFQNRSSEGGTLNQIGDLYASLSAIDLARKSYLQALDLFEKQENWSGLGATLRQLGHLEFDLNHFSEAIAYYQRANQISQDAGNRGLQISVLTGLSRTYAQAQNHDAALKAINEALQVVQTANFKDYENLCLGVKGRILIQAGDYPQALAVSQTAFKLLTKESKPEAKAAILSNIGEVYGYLNQPKPALENYEQSLLVWREIGNRTEEAYTLYKIAKLEYQDHQFQAGLAHITAAITIIEQIRSNIVSSELRTSFFSTNQSYYKLKIDLLMNLHRQNPTQGFDALALNTSESNRARSLLDILTEANVDIRQGVDPQLLAQEQSLQQSINNTIKQQIAIASYPQAKSQAATLKQEIEQLLTRYKEIQDQIRRASPRYAALTQPKPLTLKEIQSQVLDANSVLLEYSLGETHSYLWVVTPTRLYSLDLPKQEDIAADVKLLRKNLSARTTPEQFELILGALSQKILQPAAAWIQNKRLLIVTDGVLRYVPFAALPNPKSPERSGLKNSLPTSPLVLDHEIVHLPSASTLAILRHETAGRKLAPRKIAVFADPVFDAKDQRISQRSASITPSGSPRVPVAVQLLQPLRGGLQRLPGTRQEAQNILELFSKPLRSQAFDFEATRALALNPKLMQYQILHFATHGILNEANPEFSGIALSLIDAKGQAQNGFLQLRDIYNLRLPAELVVLSACQTGGGKEIQGEGIIGLTRGFMYAGAKSTVVSLWSVDDQATAELMTRFYRKMQQEHLSPAAALRAAQVELWEQPERRSPYYWAAFQLQGDWQWRLRNQ